MNTIEINLGKDSYALNPAKSMKYPSLESYRVIWLIDKNKSNTAL